MIDCCVILKTGRGLVNFVGVCLGIIIYDIMLSILNSGEESVTSKKMLDLAVEMRAERIHVSRLS